VVVINGRRPLVQYDLYVLSVHLKRFSCRPAGRASPARMRMECNAIAIVRLLRSCAPGRISPRPACWATMAGHMKLALQLLGPFQLLAGDGQPIHLRRKTRAVLAYLAAADRPHGRITLAGLFCQASDDPQRTLRLLLSLIAGASAAFLASTSGAGLRSVLRALFALDAENVSWFVTRSSGFVAYLLLWLSTAWGLAIPSKILDRWLQRTFTFDFHQFISLLSLAFLALHVSILLFDQYMPFTWAQLLVPFLSPYRPLWVGIGVIALYLTALVTVTFYIRRWIGMKTFRYIHYSSLLAYLGATAHSFFSGTDSSLTLAWLMYAGTFLVVVFLTVYWLYLVWQGAVFHQR